ncbi:MAG: cytochrome c oxidase accessory protein CcoG [Alphaproteobacteria bacterium]
MNETVPTEDAVSVKSRPETQTLYVARNRVYPKRVRGPIRRIKWAVLCLLLTIYYVTPWLRWDRGPDAPDQAVLLDMTGHRAYFFFIEIWPQELYYLAGILILAAIVLFFVTSLMGRLWCGYSCPQTVWTDLFMFVERTIEGDRGERISRDKGRLTFDKAWRKTAKHAIWLVIALMTGGAWIMYFNDAPTLVHEVFTGTASERTYFFIGLFTATTYVLAGWAREQVCTYMCPWPRFQAAMFDESTYTVTYERWRGEPRGKYRKGETWDSRGDCVDCRQCVAVCPTGIDIRDGIQLECINCGLCIDACNGVMEKIGRPPDLIRFDTQVNQVARAAGKPGVFRLFRLRTVFYALLMVGIAGVMLVSLAFRSKLEVNVLHDRSPLFVELSDGRIQNGYTVKVLNMERASRQFRLAIEGLPGAVMQVVGDHAAPARETLVDVGQDDVGTFRVFLKVPAGELQSDSTPVTIRVTERVSGESVAHVTMFRAPAPVRK